MRKSIICMCILLAGVVCTTFTACEKDPQILFYGAEATGIAIRNESYVIEVDSTQPADMRRFVVPPISKDSLFRYLLTGGWAETEAYGLYLDGSMTENLQNLYHGFHIIFENDNNALLIFRYSGTYGIRYTYDEENNYLTLSNLCLPPQYFEEVRKQEEGYSEETERIISISDEEMLVIGPGGLYVEDFDPPTPSSLRVFTHVSDDEAKDWKRRR